MENIGDALVLSALRQGSEEALNTLYKNYSHQVLLHVMWLLDDEDEAKDILQDVFIYIWCQREKLPDIKDFRQYLVKAGRNRALTKIEKKQTDYSRERKYFQNAPLYEDPNISHQSLVDELLPAIDKYLSPSRANAMKQVYLEGRKQQEVANEMGITVPALRGIIVSSMKKLREILKK